MLVDGPFAALAYRFEIAVEDPSLSACLGRVLAGLKEADEGKNLVHRVKISGSQAFSLVVDGTALAENVAPNELLSRLIQHLNSQAVSATSDHLLLHAGAVATARQAVLFPAPMESGKTTLTAGLVMRGLDYVTDETVAIRPDPGTILPFPKPLSVDPGSWEVLADLRPAVEPGFETLHQHQWQGAPDDIRPGALAGPCQPSLVVAPRYRPGAPTALEPITRAEAVLVLAQNSFNFRDQGRRFLPVLGRLVAQCRCFRLSVGDLATACDEVMRLVEARHAVPA